MDDTKVAQAVAGFSETQVEKALELIAAGGVIPTNRRFLFLTVSSDGSKRYRTTSDTCDCEARGRCKHNCAVRLVIAAGRAA